jgi:uncharacterized protein with FMN-binding domain
VRRVILAVASTVTGLVLLLGFKTQSAVHASVTPAAIAPGSATGSTTTTPSAAPSTGSSSTGSSSGSTGSTASKTVTGSSVDTRWGPVQVRITVVNGKITSAQAVDYPQNNPRDQEINAVAIPQLQQETISAGSASIDMVSGATYTSQGYIQSLQSALDQL